MDKPQQAIGKRIRRARMDANMKQQEVADSVNISRSNYQKIEAGNIGVSGVMLSQLSQLFNTTVEELVTSETDLYRRHPGHQVASDPNSAYYDLSPRERSLTDKVTLLEEMLRDKEEIIKLLKEKLNGADE
ncbi:MAG: helix-turn-helix transcriptional regulator [Bacteroidota bacterium]